MRCKRLISKLLALTIVVTSLAGFNTSKVYADEAATVEKSWDSGNTTVTLYTNGDVIIEAKQGTDGKMKDYSNDSGYFPPWKDYSGGTWSTPQMGGLYYAVKFKKIIFKDGVTSIGKYAFSRVSYSATYPEEYKFSIVEVDMCDSITSIGEGAFTDQEYLTKVKWSPNIKTIELMAFYNTSISSNDNTLVFWDKLESVTGFHNLSKKSNITKIVLPASIKEVGQNAFERCNNLNEIIVEGTPEISKGAFQYLQAENIKFTWENVDIIPEALLSMDKFATGYPIFGNRLTSISTNGLSFTTGVEITLSKSLQTIGDKAFKGATWDKLVFQDGLQSIGKAAFSNSKISKLYIYDRDVVFYDDNNASNQVFANCNGNTTVYCWKNSTAHQYCEKWSVPYVLLDGIPDPSIKNDTLEYDKYTGTNLEVELENVNDASDVKNISIDTTNLSSDTDYTVTTSSITVKKDVLDSLSTGIHSIEVEFSGDIKVSKDLEITDSKPSPTIKSDSFTYDKYIDTKLEIELENINDVTDIKEVKIDSTVLDSDIEYASTTSAITIKKDALNGLSDGTHEINIKFNGDIKATASLEVSDSTPAIPVPPVVKVDIAFDFFKDNPKDVKIPVTWNDATDVEVEGLKLSGLDALTSSDYEVEADSLIIKSSYLDSVDAGKYKVLITFNDKDNTKKSGIIINIFDEMADLKSPRLIADTHTVDGNDINMEFYPGTGSLETYNILSLILDDEIILPDGSTVANTTSNIKMIRKAFALSLEEEQELEKEVKEDKDLDNIEKDVKLDEEESESEKESDSVETLPDSNTNNEDETDKNTDSSTDDTVEEKEDKKEEKESEKKEEETEENKSETEENKSETEENKSDKSEASDSLEGNTESADKSSDSVEEVITADIKLASVITEKAEDLVELFKDIDTTAFEVSGTTITLKGDYLNSLSLSVGNHYVGAIFDNSEQTKDLKKVILVVPDPNSGGDTTPDNPDGDTTPDNPDGDNNNNSGGNVTPDNGNHSGGSGGNSSSSSSDGSSYESTPSDKNSDKNNSSTNTIIPSEGNEGLIVIDPTNPDGIKPEDIDTKTPINEDGSLNPYYKPEIPDDGGEIVKKPDSNNDYIYIKPDGSIAKNEWVSDGEGKYHTKEDGTVNNDWYLEDTSTWYVFENKDSNKAATGWYYESQDNKWYYLNNTDNKMLTGWQFINGNYHYFTEVVPDNTYYGNNEAGWKYDRTKKHLPYGSMYQDTVTPDGYKVNEQGVWVR